MLLSDVVSTRVGRGRYLAVTDEGVVYKGDCDRGMRAGKAPDEGCGRVDFEEYECNEPTYEQDEIQTEVSE